MTRCLILTVLMLVGCQGAACAATRDDFTGKTSFRCGETAFTSTTHLRGMTVWSQVVTARLESGQTTKLDLRETPILQHDPSYTGQALNASVEGWQCKTIGHRRFLVFMYACNLDMNDAQIARYCTATGEWVRYLDTRGRLFDDAYALEDPRYDALDRKLGYHVDHSQARDDCILGSMY